MSFKDWRAVHDRVTALWVDAGLGTAAAIEADKEARRREAGGEPLPRQVFVADGRVVFSNDPPRRTGPGRVGAKAFADGELLSEVRSRLARLGVGSVVEIAGGELNHDSVRVCLWRHRGVLFERLGDRPNPKGVGRPRAQYRLGAGRPVTAPRVIRLIPDVEDDYPCELLGA